MKIPFRIVGTHEYLSALNQLIKLSEKSNNEELKVYDKIIAEHEEYSFFSGLMFTRLNNKSYRNSTRKIGAERNYKRNNLAWLMALARVEIAATIAMYGELPNAFEFVAPTRFGRSEYYQLLNHDVVDHINALKTDPLVIEKTRNSSPADSDTIAYLRRLKVVREMLMSAQYNNGDVHRQDSKENLRAINQLAIKLNEKVRDATEGLNISYEIRIPTEEAKTRTSTQTRTVAGTVEARSEITRLCQQAFLHNYGK